MLFYTVEDINPGGCKFQVTGLQFEGDRLIAEWTLTTEGVFKKLRPEDSDTRHVWSNYEDRTGDELAEDPAFTTSRDEALGALKLLLMKALEVAPTLQDSGVDATEHLLTTWWRLQEYFQQNPHPLVTPVFTDRAP